MLQPVRAFGVIERGTARTPVSAGTKGSIACARHDHGTHGIVGIRDIECGNHVLHHLPGERIHAIGPMESDRQNSFADFNADRFKVGQGHSPIYRPTALTGFFPIEKSAREITRSAA